MILRPPPSSKVAAFARIKEHRQRYPDDRLFLLADGALQPEILSDIRRQWPQLQWQSLYSAWPEGASAQYTPLLLTVDLNHTDENPLLKWFFDSPDLTTESGCLIWTAHDLNSIAAHLSAHTQVITPEKKRALLRFHAPSVLVHALTAMSDAQRQHLMAPLSMLCWMDLDGRWQKKTGQGRVVPAPIKPEVAWSTQQIQLLEERLRPQKIHSQVWQEHADWLGGSQEGWCADIAQWLADAKATGIQTFEDQYLYCVIALTVGADFVQDAQIEEHLTGMAEGKTNFAQAMKSVSPKTWVRLEQKRTAPRRSQHPQDRT